MAINLLDKELASNAVATRSPSSVSLAPSSLTSAEKLVNSPGMINTANGDFPTNFKHDKLISSESSISIVSLSEYRTSIKFSSSREIIAFDVLIVSIGQSMLHKYINKKRPIILDSANSVNKKEKSNTLNFSPLGKRINSMSFVAEYLLLHLSGLK